MPEELLALDRASARRIDQDGHLHIAVSNFSRACVSPYRGAEIPEFASLGLKPDRVYQLLRPADELQRAAATFNGKPLLSQHQPLSSEDHPDDLTVGSAGNDTRFENPWLRGSLTVWRQDAIDAINTGERKHISLGYRYTPVMTPGVFEGERYDGIMRNISGNHITLVEQPRVPGAVVGDSALRLENSPMPPVLTAERRTQVATLIHRALRTRTLAQDATIEQLNELLGNLEPSAAAGMPPGAPGALPGAVPPPVDPAAAVVDPAAVAPPAAAPMTTLAPPPDDVVDAPPGVDPTAPPGADPAAPPGAGGGKMDQLLQLLEANLPPEIMAQVRQIAGEIAAEGAGGAEAPPAEEPPAPEGASSDPPSDQPPSEPDDDKTEDAMPPELMKPAKDGFPKAGKPPAMDAAAIEQRVIARMHSIEAAKRAVQPLVGHLAADFDSADAVFKWALDSAGVNTKGMHPSAYPEVIKLVRQHEEAPPARVAMDAAQATEFGNSFKNFGRLKQA